MRVAVVGGVCLVAGVAIGAAGTALAGGEEDSAPPAETVDGRPAEEQDVDRGGHVLVFLSHGVTEAERAAIEAAIAARQEVEDYEYWNDEASRAEAIHIFRDNPEMLEKVESGSTVVPTSFRLLLRDPSMPDALVVEAQINDLPGVQDVTILDNVPQLGE
jgi:FtsX extracellular domain